MLFTKSTSSIRSLLTHVLVQNPINCAAQQLLVRNYAKAGPSKVCKFQNVDV